jgi:hypothetical protein
MGTEPDSIADMYKIVHVSETVLHMCEVLNYSVKRIPLKAWVECCNDLQLG